MPIRRLVICWAALAAIAAAEFGVSFAPLGRDWRTVLLIFPITMALLIAIFFMRVRTGPGIVRGFALAGLVWLTILLGLGTMDPLTRTVYPVDVALKRG